MLETTKNLIKHLLSQNKTVKKWLMSHHLGNYLEQIGWYRSFETRMPVKQNGNSIP